MITVNGEEKMARKRVNLLYYHEKEQTLSGVGRCLILIFAFMDCSINFLRDHFLTGNTSLAVLIFVNVSLLADYHIRI